MSTQPEDDTITNLLDLPEEVLTHILRHYYADASSKALHVPCFVDSAEALRRGRKVKRVTEGAVTLGGTCRRFREIHLDNRLYWKDCVRALWVARTFDLIRSVGRQQLWRKLMEGFPEQEFVWERGWRHRSWQRDLEERAFAGLLVGARPLEWYSAAPRRVLAQWVIETVSNAERQLRSLAVQARSRAVSAPAQEVAVEQVCSGVMDMLARLVDRAVPTMLPGLWEEVQVVAAIWLTAAASVHRYSVPHRQTDVAIPEDDVDHTVIRRAIYEQWDHVHNGVIGEYYWRTMRKSFARHTQPDGQTVDNEWESSAEDYATFVRIWSRAGAIVSQRIGAGDGESGRLAGAFLPLPSPDDPAWPWSDGSDGRRGLLTASAARDPH